MSNGHLSLAGSVGALFQPELPRVRMVGSVCRVLYLELLFSASAAHSSDWVSNGHSTHLAPAGAVRGTSYHSLVLGTSSTGTEQFKCLTIVCSSTNVQVASINTRDSAALSYVIRESSQVGYKIESSRYRYPARLMIVLHVT